MLSPSLRPSRRKTRRAQPDQHDETRVSLPPPILRRSGDQLAQGPPNPPNVRRPKLRHLHDARRDGGQLDRPADAAEVDHVARADVPIGRAAGRREARLNALAPVAQSGQHALLNDRDVRCGHLRFPGATKNRAHSYRAIERFALGDSPGIAARRAIPATALRPSRRAAPRRDRHRSARTGPRASAKAAFAAASAGAARRPAGRGWRTRDAPRRWRPIRRT